MLMSKERKTVNWNVVVSKDFDRQVEEAVNQGIRASKSELIRDGVRRLLEKERKRARTAQASREGETKP
jgi:putative addiction module CopG family antidote